MFSTLHQRARREDGFTLIELLVVILIIGILAAIAIPSFTSQTAKANDASAKSNVRNAVSQMESCFTDTQAYNVAPCNSATTLFPGSGITGTTTSAKAEGAVSVDSTTATTYKLTGYSKGSRTFSVEYDGSTYTYSCRPVNSGGCPSSGLWAQ